MKIIEGALDTLQFFFIFLLTVRRIRMFFSLKPSQSQGESSLKISARWGSPFRKSQGTNKQTNTLTHSLTDWCFYRVIPHPQHRGKTSQCESCGRWFESRLVIPSIYTIILQWLMPLKCIVIQFLPMMQRADTLIFYLSSYNNLMKLIECPFQFHV